MDESLSSTCLHLDNHDHDFLKQIDVSLKDPIEKDQCLAYLRQGIIQPAQEGHPAILRTKPLPAIPNHPEFYLPTTPVLQLASGA